MKIEKIESKKAWVSPTLRRIPLTDEVIQALQEQNPDFSFNVLRKRAAAE